MEYPSSSRPQAKRTPTDADTVFSSRQAVPNTSIPSRLQYFTAAASSSRPYESPYAQNQDRRPPHSSESSVRVSSRSTSVYPTLAGSPISRGSLSKQSSPSLFGSIYDPPDPRGSSNTTPGDTMNTQRTMSSVSSLVDLLVLFDRFALS